MANLNFPKIYYGGDYNPDQWDERVWEEDIRLFKLAGVNLVTLPVFAWARLQPSEDKYDFEWLDRILDMLYENGISFCLATPTAAQPAWMSRKYPDILPVDEQGRKRSHGKRVNFCPSSPTYRKFAAHIVSKMADRYGKHPGLALWHIANEYGTYCYCAQCESAFRKWLKHRYGTMEELNTRWNLSFWGHSVYDWEDIVVPSELNDDNKWYQPIMLDYLRFMTDTTIECFLNEKEILKSATPDVPITTNMSGFIKKLDQFKFTRHMDIVGWDNYPAPDADRSLVALKHDIMRGLKGGQSYLLVEQSPNQQNWQPYNALKRPGQLRILSYQALAHGADAILYFQMRQSIAGVEKLHGALISHAGHENTRTFKECAKIGDELKKLGNDMIGSRCMAQVGILFDWDNWWAVEMSSGPSRDLNYLEQVRKYYNSFYDKNIPLDILSTESDFDRYTVIVAPLLYMIHNDVAKRLDAFVQNGGTLIVSFFSGIVDENDRVHLGGYPGPLKDVLGIWVEETDALLPGNKNKMMVLTPQGSLASEYECSLLCDLLHLQGASALAVYGADFYAGYPCLTVNQYGKGQAYYIASDPEEEMLSDLAGLICDTTNILPPLDVPKGVEVTRRVSVSQASEFIFVLNHTHTQHTIRLGHMEYCEMISGRVLGSTLTLEPCGVAILKKKICIG